MSRPHALTMAAAILAVLCTVVYWPVDDSGVPGAKLLSAAQLRDLPAGADSDRLVGHHLGCLVFGHGGVGTWADLPTEAHHVWATIAFESQTAHGLLPFYRGQTDGPSLADIAAAYRAMEAPEMAALVEQLAKLNANSSTDALAAMESRLATVLPRAAEQRHGYVVEHAEEIAGSR